MNLRSFGLACTVALSANAAGAVSLDFEGVFTPGLAVPDQGFITGTEFAGVTITLGGADAGQLGLYDSSCRSNCTGNTSATDNDLATGTNITNPPINASENTPAENHVLINAEQTNSGFGDIDGDSVFTFTFDVPSIIKSFVLIDIDENFQDVAISFNYTNGTTPSVLDEGDATSILNSGADNSWSEFDIAILALNDPNLLLPVSSLEIAFDGISGGIASIHATPVPVPAALPLLVSGLGLMGWMARRRKAT